MNKKIFAVILVVLATGIAAYAASEPYNYKGYDYYVVNGNDSAMNSGAKVCANVGKQCVGYTANTNDVCGYFHSSASKTTSVNGSKAGFYCDGSPQKGLACENNKNNCQICPNCNVNADCNTQIGDQFREMYIECASGDKDLIEEVVVKSSIWQRVFSIPGRWWGGMRSAVARSFDFFREKLGRLTMKQIIRAVVEVDGPNGKVRADISEDSYVCEFYQKNKKLATCGALAAADNFCVTAMNSRFATAALCQDDGVIVCSNPCTTNPQQIKPKQCAFDNDRVRGKQASPLDFCNQTIKVDMGGLGNTANKKAGQECAHGGECQTGFCLGQPSDNGIKYFCSCKQNVHDTSCNK
ncbi:MAG: hypothetical protein Q7S12_04430 [bacterium]|nr:hypothetical protein [bacterium]